MGTSDPEANSPTQSSDAAPDRAAFRVCQLANLLQWADEVSAVSALTQAAQAGGADAALFVWVVPNERQYSYRSIAALDPGWCAATLRRLHMGSCSWLTHASRSSGPVLACDNSEVEIAGCTADTDIVIRPRTTWVIPAPPPPGSDVLGLLMLAGKDELQLEGINLLIPVYRAFALALSDWFQRRGAEELVGRAHLTERDVDLLRRELQGQGSKQIASALGAEPKTIDCRFHRLNVRLGVSNRREAVRLCRRYGLL